MAKFIGSKIKDNNWGEDYFISKLMEYFDDSYVIYRNRPIFGAQFDVCLLVPNFGIIIFEVKGWRPETVLRVENGDNIIIRTVDDDTKEEGEASENPTGQARDYVYKMRKKIHSKTGKNPPVYDMVCFPNITKEQYDQLGIEPVCEYETTILKDDLQTKELFHKKMNLGMKNHKDSIKYLSKFNENLMFRTRQIFESNLKPEDQNIDDTDIIEGCEVLDKTDYSILAYIPDDDNTKKRIERLALKYKNGTKLFLIVDNVETLKIIHEEIDKVISGKGLIADGLNLKINFEEIKKENSDNTRSYGVFNCSAYLLPKYEADLSYFEIKDGVISDDNLLRYLEFVDKNSNFNIEQFKVEHAETEKNIIVRAGAGTGKTFTMISRIAFICHMQSCSMKEMSKRIVMITFTDDAANQMEDKIKQYFNNYYLLTGDTECLAFINQIEGMQISTIHSYAKKIIAQLGFEFGYGDDLSVTSGDYKRKQIIARRVDEYIVEGQKKYGQDFVKKLGMPVYMINKDILSMLTRLHNQSIDIASLEKENFGKALSGSGNVELHNLISELIPKIEKEFDEYLKEQNRVHLNNMMSLLRACISNQENIQRLIKMQTGRTQFMFVDEFQDTDDVQIEALTAISKLLQYKLFVVGDVKQCIYRFRGAKENAFDQLNYEGDDTWVTFVLYKNYRTDKELLNLFHNSFDYMGKQRVDNEQLLMYTTTEEKNSDRLIGTRNYNNNLAHNQFYRKVSINDEDSRMAALFEEVKRQSDLIRKIENDSGKKLSSKEREIAILVRENWQAEIIKREGKSRNIDVITNTGGDLYMSEPALDMLKLANALLHYDESDFLYTFVSSNFIDGGMSKSYMYNLREKYKKYGWKKSKASDTNQAKEIQKLINMLLSNSEEDKWGNWNSIIKLLRTTPVLQVMRKLYFILKPWVQYGGDSKSKQDNYRLNVDLLFEEMINSANMASLSINSFVDLLTANIVSRKNVDSRMSEVDSDEIIIRCVTVHKSKGLEYGAVILPYCSSAINIMKRADMNICVFNERDSAAKIGYQIKVKNNETETVFQNDLFNEDLEKNERMREEARILYVAMTRAIRSFSWISLDNKKTMCWQNLVWEEK